MSTNNNTTMQKRYSTSSRPPLSKKTNLELSSPSSLQSLLHKHDRPLNLTSSSLVSPSSPSSSSASSSSPSPSSSCSKPSTSSSIYTNKASNNQKQQFHRRQIANSTFPSLPKPSNKPPSTTNNFTGDLQSQDVFASSIQTQNPKVRVLFPGMDLFEMERMDMYNHDSICTPCLIVQPKSNKEVSDVLIGYTDGVKKCLVHNKQKFKYQDDLQLAIPRLTIAGGRNSINAMRDGSIVLDMSRMRGIKVDTKNQECTIQGGVRVMDLDAKLSEYGYVAMTSIFQNLGVVGCILSGGCGFGYGTRKFGLACDNVLEAEVVLADGRLKRCSRVRHTDLFHSLCGGGGGFGVVVSVTLKCYPLLHAALLTYDIPTHYKQEDIIQRRRIILNEWDKWLHGSGIEKKRNCNQSSINSLSQDRLSDDNASYAAGVNNDVFSQLVIPTKKSSSVKFIGTSIDENAIPQIDGFIDKYEEVERKKRGMLRGSIFTKLKNGNCSALGNNNMTKSFRQHNSSSEQMRHHGWDKTPGLADLIENKFGANIRQNVQFRIVRYADDLQMHSNEYYSSGNIYIATKYIKHLTARIIEILVLTTLGDASPNNESKIHLNSLGGQVNDLKDVQSIAFTARDIKYVVVIEGRWEALSEQKYTKEKRKVTKWVNWVVNLLNREEGIQSTSHPEAVRDQIPKRSKPPSGWYNFDELSGTKLNETKKKRDPKNVFSLASRVSWLHESQSSYANERCTDENNLSSQVPQPISNEEVDQTDYLTPKNIQQPNISEAALESLLSNDGIKEIKNSDEHVSHEVEVSDGVIEVVEEEKDINSISSDLRHLLDISDSDDELKEWTFSNKSLTRIDSTDGISLKSISEYDTSF